VRLSERKKQRLGIGRALLRNGPILILDEPTSALDARSEQLRQSALGNILRGRTTFVIAHRLATILRANRILVVDDGRIAEQGSHSELTRASGLYRELYEMQFYGRQSGKRRNEGHGGPAMSAATAKTALLSHGERCG
jgi:ABC-type multidrug transport system fused ATPase/permease subunit